MITSPCGMTWSSSIDVKGSSTASARSARHLMSFGIDGLLKRGETGATVGVDETLAGRPFAKVDLDELVDRRRHALGGKRRAQALANRRVVLARAAQGKLIEFLS